MSTTVDKTSYFDKAIDWAKNRNFSDVKANYEGFEQPTQFTKEDEERPYIPDITAKKHDRKYYIEIATKTDDTQRTISKWKLLSALAEMKGGKLFLLAPKGHKAHVQRILKKHDLNARLLYMPNIADPDPD